MSLAYFARYRFSTSDIAAEDYGVGDLAVESGSLDVYEDSQYGPCLSLNGETSLMSSGDYQNIVDDSDRCFSFWIKPLREESSSPVLCYGELSSPNAFVLYAKNDQGYPEFYDYSTRVFDPSHPIVPVNTWTFVAFSFKSGILSTYIDGDLRSATNVNLQTGASDPFRVGTDGLGEYLEGYLLDLRIWESSVEESAIQYMYTVGPNFEEFLATDYAKNTSTRSGIFTGNVLCRESYGVHGNEHDNLRESYFCLDDSTVAQESARVEYSKGDDSEFGSKLDIRVRDTDSYLPKTIEMSPETTTFVSSSSNSVIFSSDGVHLASGEEKGSFYFGANKDFRMRVGNGSFLIEALSSPSNTYVKKMEILP